MSDESDGETSPRTLFFIVVEGQPDAMVVYRLLRHLGFAQQKFTDEIESAWSNLIPSDFPDRQAGGDITKRVSVPLFFVSADKSVALLVAGDWKSCLLALRTSVEVVQADGHELKAACLILDADDKSADDCFETLQKDCPVYDFGSRPGDFGRGNPRCGAYFLPNNQDSGTLEQLLLEQADRAYPELKKLACAYREGVIEKNALSNQDQRPLRKPVGPEKALLSAMSAILKPEKGLAISLQDNDWFRFKHGEPSGANTEVLYGFLKRFLEC